MDIRDVKEKVFDLTDSRDLEEIEKICGRPDRFKVLVDETITLPFRHMRFEVIRKDEK